LALEIQGSYRDIAMSATVLLGARVDEVPVVRNFYSGTGRNPEPDLGQHLAIAAG
jgi:hypothetical protein